MSIFSQRRPRWLLAPGIIALLALSSPTSSAWADSKCADQGAEGTTDGVTKDGDKGKRDGNFHVEERDGEKVYVIDTVVTVCGKVPRPLVAYVLQPRTINYEWVNLKQAFLPKILESVKKAPF